jgi:hypothetical protein
MSSTWAVGDLQMLPVQTNRIDGVFNCGKKVVGTAFSSHGDRTLPAAERTRYHAGDLHRGSTIGTMPFHRPRHIVALLCTVALLAGCATPADREAAPARHAVAATGSEGGRTALASKDPVVDLSPAQALAPRAQGARVRWSGGINAIDAREDGRQCFTLLHATFDPQGVLQWPRDAQNFVACGPGYYDRDLVAQFTLVSFEGHVTGQRVLLDKPVAVMEIEALYRHSDCVQGSEKSPECYSGYLRPQRP